MTFEEVKRYYQDLLNHLNDPSGYIVENPDSAHNAAIMSLMLDSANSINMYCGSMSVFRKPFYDKIEPSEKPDENLGEEIKNMVAESLKVFFKKDGSSLHIVTRDFKETYLDDLIVKESFKEAIKNGKVRIKEINDRRIAADSLTHFSVTDNRMIRMEQDPHARSGLCAVAVDKETVESLQNDFNIISANSQPVESDSKAL